LLFIVFNISLKYLIFLARSSLNEIVLLKERLVIWFSSKEDSQTVS